MRINKLLIPVLLFICATVFNLFAQNCEGKKWIKDNTEISNLRVISFNSNDDYSFIGTAGKGIWRSSDKGRNWIRCDISGIPDGYNIRSIASYNKFVYAGTDSVLFISSNGGNTFNTISNLRSVYLALVCKDSVLYAGLNKNGKGVQYSTDNGKNFTPIFRNHTVYALAIKDNRIFAGTGDSGIYTMNPDGTDQVKLKIDSGLLPVYSVFIHENYVYAGTEKQGLYISSNSGVNWTHSPFTPNVNFSKLSVKNGFLFVGQTDAGSKGLSVLDLNGNSIGFDYEGCPGNIYCLWELNNYLFICISEKSGSIEVNQVYKIPLRNVPFCR